MGNSIFQEYLKHKSTPSTQGQALFVDYQRRKANQLFQKINALQDKVMNLGTQYNARYFDANGQALPFKWRADSGDWLKTVEPQWKANIAEADAMAEQLRGYKDYLDEDTYTKAMDAINASAEGNRAIFSRAQQEHAAFSPFTNEKDYNYVSSWYGQDETAAQQTWNNLNRNKTLAYSQDDAAMIDEAEYALNLFADYYAGTGRSDSVSRMTQEYQQNRRIQRRDEIDSQIDALRQESGNYAADVQKTLTDPQSVPGVNTKDMSDQWDRNTKLKDLELERDQLNASINYYESHDQKYNQAMAGTGNADFGEIAMIQDLPQNQNPTRAEMDAYDQSTAHATVPDGVYVPAGQESQYSRPTATTAKPEIKDPLGLYLNASEAERTEAIDINSTTGGTWARAISKGVEGRWDLMREDDVAAYYYILNTKGTKDAEKFLEDISTRLLQRENEAFTENLEKASTGELVAAAALSVFTKPFTSILGGGSLIASGAKGEYFNPNLNPLAQSTDAIREELSKRANVHKDNFIGNVLHAITGMEYGELLQTAFSFADSNTTRALFGPASSVVLGMDAARSAATRTYENGGSKGQIFATAFMAGLAETVFEYVSLEHFADKVLDGKYYRAAELLKQGAIQGGVEASEEVFTEIANTISNGIIMGKMSDYNIAVQAYISDGYSEADAKKKATSDVLANIWSSAAGGFLSGGARTAIVGPAILAKNQAAYGKQIKQSSEAIAKDKNSIDKLITVAENAKPMGNKFEQAKIDKQIAAVKADPSVKNIKALENTANKVTRDYMIETGNKALKMAETEEEKQDAQRTADIAKTNPDFAGSLVMANQEAMKNKGTYSVGTGTTNKATGEDIKITGVHRTRENGKPSLVFELEDGSTINASDVSYDSSNKAVVAETLADTGIRADYAMSLYNSVTDSKEGAYVAAGIQDAINSGMIGESFDMAKKGRFASDLTAAQLKTAYNAGKSLSNDYYYNKRKGLASQKTSRNLAVENDNGKVVGKFYDGTEGANLRETTKAQLEQVKQIAKILNANVEIYASSVVDGVRQFTDRRGVAHKGNAAYIPGTNTIVIDINAGDTLNGLVLNAMSHEVVHYIAEFSPDKFRKLADFVVGKFGEKGKSVTDLTLDKQSKYAAQGEKLTFMEAFEEVVADSVESMLSQKADKIASDIAEMRKVDADLAKTFVDKVKEIAKKILKVFKKNNFQANPETVEGKFFAKWTEVQDELASLFAEGAAAAADTVATTAKTTGAIENTSAEAAADAADKAAQAARRTDTVSKNKKPADDAAGVKNSLRQFEDGTRFVDVKTDQHLFDGLSLAEKNTLARNIIKQRFSGRVIGGENPVFVNSESAKEYSHPARNISDDIRDAKMRSATELDNLIAAGENLRTEPDGKDGHVHPGVKNFSYLDVIFKVGNDYYSGIVNIENNNRGKRLKDITKIKNITEDIISSYGNNPKSEFLRDVSIDSISNPSEKSNPQFEKNSNSLRNVTERQTIMEMLDSLSYEVEHNQYFQEYRNKAKDIDRKQAMLDDLNEEWRELMFQKGKRSEETKARLAEIRTEADRLGKQIAKLDSRLLELAEFRPFRNLVKAAEKKQKAADAKKMTEYRKEVKRRADRAKVVRALKDLGSYLTHESKDHHIPAELRKQFAKALDSFNLDYSKNGSKEAKHFLGDLADAIAAAQKTNSPLVTAWADSNITDKLAEVKELVGNTKLYYLNQEQMDAMYELFRMMKRRITTANKLHNENIKISATKAAEKSSAEISQWKTKRSGKSSQFGWDNLKPYAFFERLGSDTLTKMYDAINQGVYKTARDLMDADKFRQKVAEKYGADSWKMSEAYTFRDATGTEMHLTLADIMSLYAHGRRNQSKLHLFKHGLVLNEEVVVEKDAGGKTKRFKVDDKKNHPINQEILTGITSKLTEDQKAYCREMQDYLSDVMGRKGNEVSLELYDLELYTEKHYWPLKTAAWYNAFDPKGGVDPKINSPSFSKQTLNNASSPIVLNGFNEVWANHVSDMSLYHGLALPVDDITRVVNAHTMDNPVNVGGVWQTMEETYGPAAGNYLSQFLRDLNSGIRSTDDAWLTKGITLAKKAATALSLSVAIQQPSSIMRAMAVIEMKYFGGLDKSLSVKGVHDAWEELKQYCPVAFIKEMGNMETGHGRSAAEQLQKQGFGKASIVEILKDKNYRKQLSGKIDDIIGFLPQFMDQITWVKIWKAAQNKARSENPNLSTQEIKKEAAKIFNKTIEQTQVCDSPTSRTGLMRKGGAATKEATAFLAEPMTYINMAYVATLNAVRGKPGAKKQLGRTMGAILGSVVLNSILKSIVTAMRDDDEDETMIEKYIEHLVGNFMADALLVTNLPYVRDIISLLEGYDVERMDMTTAGNIVDSIKAMIKDGATAEEVLDVVFAVAGMFGVPLKNVKRDIKGIINTVGAVADEVGGKRTTTWTGIWSAALEGVPFTKEANKGDMLYRAYASGDSMAVQNYRAQYASESAANSGIKSALRDQRAEDIKKAAQLRYNGDVNGSVQIVKQIARETNIPEELVQQAVMAELSTMTKKKDENKYDGGYESKESNPSAYTMMDLKLAVEQGRECDDIIDAIIADKKAQGATANQAKSQVKNSLAATYKSKYMDAYLAGDKKEMDRIISLLVKTGLWDRSAITNIMKNYIKNEEDSR